uniref:Uncharacterized protein n=1 Tax=Anguilla anguilla TaxID=7936 RepID=A0A0E9VFZ0_ANGAN
MCTECIFLVCFELCSSVSCEFFSNTMLEHAQGSVIDLIFDFLFTNYNET